MNSLEKTSGHNNEGGRRIDLTKVLEISEEAQNAAELFDIEKELEQAEFAQEDLERLASLVEILDKNDIPYTILPIPDSSPEEMIKAVEDGEDGELFSYPDEEGNNYRQGEQLKPELKTKDVFTLGQTDSISLVVMVTDAGKLGGDPSSSAEIEDAENTLRRFADFSRKNNVDLNHFAQTTGQPDSKEDPNHHISSPPEGGIVDQANIKESEAQKFLPSVKEVLAYAYRYYEENGEYPFDNRENVWTNTRDDEGRMAVVMFPDKKQDDETLSISFSAAKDWKVEVLPTVSVEEKT